MLREDDFKCLEMLKGGMLWFKRQQNIPLITLWLIQRFSLHCKIYLYLVEIILLYSAFYFNFSLFQRFSFFSLEKKASNQMYFIKILIGTAHLHNRTFYF